MQDRKETILDALGVAVMLGSPLVAYQYTDSILVGLIAFTGAGTFWVYLEERLK